MKTHSTVRHAERDREIRQHILQAAQELFLAQGYKGVSMKDIAEVVHVTSAALYYHFPEGKSQLFTEMLRAMLGQWATLAQQAIASGTTLAERMAALAGLFSGMRQDSIAALMRDTFLQLPPLLLDGILLEGRDAFQRHLVAMFQEAIAAGEIRADVTALAMSQMFEAMLFAPPLTLMSDQAMVSVDMIINVLLDGLRPRP